MWKRNTASEVALERWLMGIGRSWKKRVNYKTKLTKRVAWHSVDQGSSKPHRKGEQLRIRAQYRSQQSSRSTRASPCERSTLLLTTEVLSPLLRGQPWLTVGPSWSQLALPLSDTGKTSNSFSQKLPS